MDSALRQFFEEHFAEFSVAVASGAYLAVIDRAAHLTEGVLAHCLRGIGQRVPRTLGERLRAAKHVLDNKTLRPKFLLSELSYFRAQKLRILHAQSHEDQVQQRGSTVRPEVGLGVATDVSELLVEVGLARY